MERGFAPVSMSLIPRLDIAYTQNHEILVKAQAAGILNFPAFCQHGIRVPQP